MNKLIRGARYSSRAAREHGRRLALRSGVSPHGDVRIINNIGERAAAALQRNDPDGRKLAKLLNKNC